MTISANYPAIRPSLLLDFANTQALDPRVTFTRSTTGTYYNGVTSALAEQNLMLQSQAIGVTSWIADQVSVVGNTAVAPDGTTTASSLIANTTSSYHRNYQNWTPPVAATYTFSVYAKANGYTLVAITDPTNGFLGASFDLSAVTSSIISGAVAVSSTSITSVGSGWYRCTVTFTSGTPTISPNIVGYPSGATLSKFDAVYTGNGTSGIYAWGAQLEQRSSVTAYNATTTTAITNYIPVLQTASANVPRFDYDPVTGVSLGLLIEAQSTNLATYSSGIGSTGWGLINSTGNFSSDIAPDGTQTVSLIQEDATTNVHGFYKTFTVVSGTAYTVSYYLKSFGTSRNIALYDINASSAVVVNPSTLTTVSGSAFVVTMTSVGNGWVRASYTTTATSTSGSMYVYLANGSSTSYTGNSYSGAYFWGGQCEAGANLTSYIPTVASQVTRSVDSASMTGTNFSSWYNIGQGTFYSEFNSSVTGADPIGLAPYGASLMSPTSVYINSDMYGALTYASNGSTTIGVNVKAAHAYNFNSGAGFLASNGSVATQTTVANSAGSAPTGLTIGSRGAGTYIVGRIKKAAYYPLSLTSAQLQALTGS